MRVAEVMHTPAVTTSPETSLHEAARSMSARNVGCLVVIDRMGYLAGIVTDRDIVVRGVAAGLSADTTVESVMSRDVATVSPHADMTTAESVMRKRGIRRVPVADEMWRPLGVVTMDDVLRAFGAQVDELVDTVATQHTHLSR